VVAVDAMEASCDLAIAWNSEITLNDFMSTVNTLFSSFHILGTNIRGYLMNVYGPQIPDQKIRMIEYLKWYKKLLSH
jgi:hypothetical protein